MQGMNRQRQARVSLLLLVLVAGFAWIPAASGQAPAPVFWGQDIPDSPFKTWSLFLVCDPKWLTDREAPALREVFDAYLAFARTSGDRHAAVWFVKGDSKPENAANIDVERNVRYCQRFQVTPSEGPHLIVTTTHPDRWKAPEESTGTDSGIVVLALCGIEPKDVIGLFRKLNDQLVTERLNTKELNSRQYWLSWASVLERGCHLLDKVTFTVTAKFVKVEKTGVCT
jgi:hypothetical protein